MLHRLGRKQKVIDHQGLIDYFPKREMFIDMFAGSLSVSIAYGAKYTVCNDFDGDVTNLYIVWQTRLEELVETIELMPISSGLMKHWNKHKETDPLKKAVRFLFLSNFGFLGQEQTLHLGFQNDKDCLLSDLKKHFLKISRFQITNLDFRKLIGAISFRHPV